MPAFRQMTYSQISPFVRMAKIQRFSRNSYPNFIKSYDCRLFFIYKGEGCLWLNNQKYEVGSGDVFVWQPGTAYKMGAKDHSAQLEIITVNFDFTDSFKNRVIPIPPERIELFQSEQLHELLEFTDVSCFNAPLFLGDMFAIQATLLEMVTEYMAQKTFFQQRINGLMLSVLSYIARVGSLPSQYSTDKSINLVIHFIQQHYAEDISNGQIGRALNFHPNYINKLIVLHTGISLHKYLMRYRIGKAMELIESTSTTVSAVAKATGFSDVNYFSKAFKRHTGFSPSDYRRKLHG